MCKIGITLHFHGTEVRKPIPSYQIYKGTVFDLVDQALDFVISKISRFVGTRSDGPQHRRRSIMSYRRKRLLKPL